MCINIHLQFQTFVDLSSYIYMISTKAWNRHPNSKYEICYLEFHIRIQNSKYMFGIPNMYSEFQIQYLEFHIRYSEFQIRIWNSIYAIRNSKYIFGIPNTLFGIPNTYLEFQIRYSEFQIRIWNSLFGIPNTYSEFQIHTLFGIPNMTQIHIYTYLVSR